MCINISTHLCVWTYVDTDEPTRHVASSRITCDGVSLEQKRRWILKAVQTRAGWWCTLPQGPFSPATFPVPLPPHGPPLFPTMALGAVRPQAWQSRGSPSRPRCLGLDLGPATITLCSRHPALHSLDASVSLSFPLSGCYKHLPFLL